MTKQAEPTGLFYRTLAVETRAVDVANRTVRVVASTETIDGHDSILRQDWDLSRFERNPVYLWNHNRFAEGANALPLGHAKDYRVEGAGTDSARLEATLVHASEAANPMAEKVLNSFNERSLRAVSVGFRPQTIRYELVDGKEIEVLSNNLLLEISATPIGSNPDALAEQKAFERAYVARMTGRDNSTSPKRGDETTNQEDSMNTKELEAALAKAEAERDAKEVSLARATAERDALDAQNAKLVKERDAAIERANTAEKALDKTKAAQCAAEVDALIGKKFTPSERDQQIELRTTNPELWEKLTKQRTDLNLLQPIIPAEPPAMKAKAAAAETDQPGKGTADAINSAAYGGQA